ncbi:MAG TPA: hypothetical protein VHB27_18850 [Rhodopila sp.]|uniref:hypothetical protein n=1 Tax=Rhodopila sp. TaxID=2480087 RepID=UPI002C7DAD7E|nr:hypothetical protein [Rhodopila sp.]HVY17289.1 hypothetical protein [Rhodopila sp.]
MTQASFDAAHDLEALLEEENARLHAGDFVTAAGFAARKEALMATLNHATLGMPAIFNNPDFQAIGRRLSRLVEDNRKLLEIAMQVQLRLVRLVASTPPSDCLIYTSTGEPLRDPLPRGLTFAAQG